MSGPADSFIETPAGRFRALTWGDPRGETVLFLHGLTAVAEVWGPVVNLLSPDRHYVAIDQRGHGDSPHGGPYHAGRFVADTRQVIAALGGPVHLVGHSMGARVAILMAARTPRLLKSVAVVDIGVEASRQNIQETSHAIERMPASFPTEDDAFAFAFPRREPTATDRAVFRARLKQPDGRSLVWRGSPEAMVEIVHTHRTRNFWSDWRSMGVRALYVRGGRSNEVSPAIYEKMKRENPGVRYVEFDGVPHNVPLVAPDRLADELESFWRGELS